MTEHNGLWAKLASFGWYKSLAILIIFLVVVFIVVRVVRGREGMEEDSLNPLGAVQPSDPVAVGASGMMAESFFNIPQETEEQKQARLDKEAKAAALVAAASEVNAFSPLSEGYFQSESFAEAITVKGAVSAVGKGAEKAAKATGKAVEKGAKATGKAVEKGAKKTVEVVKDTAKKVPGALKQGATLAGEVVGAGVGGAVKGTVAASGFDGDTLKTYGLYAAGGVGGLLLLTAFFR